MFGDLAETYCGVSSNAGLLIVGGFCQVFEQLAVDGPIREFGDDYENGF